MECDICRNDEKTKVSFLCPICANNELYLPRFNYAQILVSNGQLTAEIERLTTDVHSSVVNPSDNDNQASQISTWNQYPYQASSSETSDRIGKIALERTFIRNEEETIKQQIENLKADLKARKSTLEVARTSTTDRCAELTTTLSSKQQDKALQLSQYLQRNMSGRAYLCLEVAALMRFRKRRRLQEDTGKELFSIAGLTLPDLREINNIRCSDLSAVLGSVAHLVMMLAFYLGVRLPAQIISPNEKNSLATILTPQQSYLDPSTISARPHAQDQSSNSPSASKHEFTATTRPRPLYLKAEKVETRTVHKIETDPTAFVAFTEGISLLAWDVAWLCRSQGSTEGTDSWEGICDIGKNLHTLLHGAPAAQRSDRSDTERTTRRPTASRKPSAVTKPTVKDPDSRLAQFSQLSAQPAHSLGINEMMRIWRLSRWEAVAADLRKNLVNEKKNAEWEMLDQQEWDDGGEKFNEAVILKLRPLDSAAFEQARSVMSVAPASNDGMIDAARKVPGTSGWTVLKNRDG